MKAKAAGCEQTEQNFRSSRQEREKGNIYFSLFFIRKFLLRQIGLIVYRPTTYGLIKTDEKIHFAFFEASLSSSITFFFTFSSRVSVEFV